MKAALLISGYMRTFNLNLSSIKNVIFSKFDEVDVFLHITKDEEAQDKYMNISNQDNLDEIKKALNPKVVLEECNIFFSSNIVHNNIYNMWLKYHKLNLLKRVYESISKKYDVVIKYRPDINLGSDIDFNLDTNTIYIPSDSKIDSSKLTHKNDKSACDTFAYGDSNSMDAYFDIYSHLSDLILNHGHVPETLMYHYLEKIDVKYREVDINYSIILSTCNVFAICGDSGSGKTTLGNLLKRYFSGSFMFECDRYHKWDRGNENWKNMTHLDPEANYLAKMNKDIFDLKIRKTIYQVDYNHHVGKFTEKQRIDSSDNIIVCGLHSLFSDSNVYDLKIFMDTSRDLKYAWKIKRDTEERGYSVDAVMEKIKSREGDFQKHILPQRNKSDIIVNFLSNERFDESNPHNNIGLLLNIIVNKKLDVTNILNDFMRHDINVSVRSDGVFNVMHFSEYKNCELFNLTNLNNFYDYIIYVILSLNKQDK